MLYITDTKALNHILMNSYTYPKMDESREALSRVVGPGVLVLEGDEHKHQRKIMNPAFSPGRVREQTDIFVEKAVQLRDIWITESVKQGGTGRVDVLSWLNKLALDIIGLAGFDYTIDALTDQQSELNEAFDALKMGFQITTMSRLKAQFPILRLVRSERDIQMQKSQDKMTKIGYRLLRDKKAQVLVSTGEKRSGRDLLSLLVQANMATDTSQRMSDQDVIAQVPTFIVAGHETTSNATSWALFALSQDQEVQAKLREELFTIDTDYPTMDQLNTLPYLDMVMREALRLHPPVPSIGRKALKDDILPLSKPVIDRHGKVHETIRINKGQKLVISIVAMNRDKAIWGEDADDFRPERWESISEASSTVPGVWGNMLTFSGGPHACIGFRFSLIEMKVLLFTLVRAFEFDLAVPSKDILKKSGAIVQGLQRPVLATDPNGARQMPMLIKPYNRA